MGPLASPKRWRAHYRWTAAVALIVGMLSLATPRRRPVYGQCAPTFVGEAADADAPTVIWPEAGRSSHVPQVKRNAPGSCVQRIVAPPAPPLRELQANPGVRRLAALALGGAAR